MPRLEARAGGATLSLFCPEDRSLRTILDATPHRVRSACSGIGACGLCRIRVLGGSVSSLTEIERLQRQAGQLAADERLACQSFARGDLRIELCAPAPRSGWCRLDDDLLGALDREDLGPVRAQPAGAAAPLGVAIDLGTTHLCFSLTDLASGAVITSRWGGNPQAAYGADLMTRLHAAVQSPEAGREMRELVVGAVADGLEDMVSREGLDPRRVTGLTVVGNTAMLALLVGRGCERLIRPAEWEAPLACETGDREAWRRRWNLPARTAIEIVQPLAGFVGSDLLCGLAACRFSEQPAPALYIDFGTNTEVALWDGARLWVTSAAGGPAFEGGWRGVVLPAAPGAIHDVRRDGERWTFAVIGDRPAEGLCGSGLVALIAHLRAEGVVSARGTFATGCDDGFSFTADGRPFRIGTAEIDALQRAKAAIGVAVAALCAHAEVPLGGLAHLVVAGAFGRHLDIASAQAIGLLPEIAGERVRMVGNGALAGCIAFGLFDRARRTVEELRRHARLFNLSRLAGFDALFLEHLHLQPMNEAGS